MPSRIYSMSFNATSTLLCVSSATDTVHVFKLTTPRSSRSASNPSTTNNNNNNNYDDRSTSPPIRRDRSLSPGESDSQLDLTRSTSQTSELKSRKPNGTLMGMIRRTSQNVGTSVAASVGAYLPHAVSEMWEPARDFAWLKIPKGGSSSGANGGGGGVLGNNASSSTQPLRSVVAMSSNSPQVMVVTNEGHFYVFGIDLEKGGEGTLVKVYEIGGESERLGASVVGSKAYE